jgi:hypothetical protein
LHLFAGESQQVVKITVTYCRVTVNAIYQGEKKSPFLHGYNKNTREIIPFLSRVLEPNLQIIYSGVVEGIDGRHIVGAARPSPS